MARTEKDSRKSRGVDVSVTGEGPMTTVYLFHLHTALVWEAASSEQREEFCKAKRAKLAEYMEPEE